MPLYEYQCLTCGRRTELLKRFEDPPLAACPECGGEVKKLVSSPAFQFKGTGWYATDYAAKKGTPESKGGEPSGGAEKAEGKAASETSDRADRAEKSEKAEKADKGEKAASAKPKEAAPAAPAAKAGSSD